jgi:hypothetical protein
MSIEQAKNGAGWRGRVRPRDALRRMMVMKNMGLAGRLS